MADQIASICERLEFIVIELVALSEHAAAAHVATAIDRLQSGATAEPAANKVAPESSA